MDSICRNGFHISGLSLFIVYHIIIYFAEYPRSLIFVCRSGRINLSPPTRVPSFLTRVTAKRIEGVRSSENVLPPPRLILVSNRLLSPSTMDSTQRFTEDTDVRIETIRTVLNLYPFSIGIFREILQNSEDAKASKQVKLARHTFFSTY